MKKLFTLGLVVLSLGVLAGCSSDTPQADKETAKAFEGGPMPPEARERMKQGMNQAQQGAMNAAEQARQQAAQQGSGQ